jgi:hypothetical protein
MAQEVYPSVTFDPRLDELVDGISVDYSQLTAVMRERGFSDEQIVKTKIAFHADAPSTNVTLENGEKMVPTGSYDYATREIGIYPRKKIEESYAVEPEVISRQLSVAVRHELEHHAEEVLEGGRKLSRSELIRMGRSAITLLGSFPILLNGTERGWNAALQLANYDPGNTAHMVASLGSVAIAGVGSLGLARPWKLSYADYRASATEINSYAIEEQVPEGLVVVRPKGSLLDESLGQ